MKRRAILLLALLVLALAAGAVPAMAAPPPQKLHIQLWPETQSDIFFLESADYPQNTPLPIQVKMAIPQGARVVWAGEIVGGPASNDIESKYQVNKKKDYDEIVFTLTKARSAQVEAGWQAAKQVGGESVVTLPWVQRYPAGTVDFGFKAPTQDSVVKMTPKWTITNAGKDNLRFYLTPPMTLAVGKKVDLRISYTGQPGQKSQQGQPTGGTGTGGSSDKALAFFVVLIAGGAVAATIFVKTRKVD